jgi:predicted hydrocarbon binding protein
VSIMTERSQHYHLVRVPAAALEAIGRVLAEDRSGEEAAILLRRMGLESGGAFHALFRGWLADGEGESPEPEDLEAERFWERFAAFFSQLGWGRLEHEQVHPGVIALSSPNWSEAAQSRSEPGCHFSTGLIAEMLQRVAGTDLAALEVECRGSGAAACRFLIGAPAALEAVYRRLRDGTGYEEAIGSLS